MKQQSTRPKLSIYQTQKMHYFINNMHLFRCSDDLSRQEIDGTVTT